jgi:Tfp pilus assembly protein PilZ
MNSNIIINSLGVGGIIFFVLLMIWFVAIYMKRRVGPDQYSSGAVSLQKVSWEEKRQQPRVSVSWKASIESDAGTANAQVKDVSHGGAFVVCKNPLELKSRLRITLTPLDQDPLKLNAEVVWSNVNVPADKIINRGMGIRFIENEEAIRNRLNQFIVSCFDDE